MNGTEAGAYSSCPVNSDGEELCRLTTLCYFQGITSYSISIWLTAPIVLIKLTCIQAFASLDYHHGAEAMTSANLGILFHAQSLAAVIRV